MAKIYNCQICKRDIMAPSMNEVIKKVEQHGKQTHNIDQYSPEQLKVIRRRIESYM